MSPLTRQSEPPGDSAPTTNNDFSSKPRAPASVELGVPLSAELALFPPQLERTANVLNASALMLRRNWLKELRI